MKTPLVMLIVLTITVSACRKDASLVPNELITELDHRLAKTMDAEQVRLDKAYEEYRDLFYDPAKRKYRDLEEVMSAIHSAHRANKREYEAVRLNYQVEGRLDPERLRSYQNEMLLQDSVILERWFAIAKENADTFGLAAEDVADHLAARKLEYTTVKEDNRTLLPDDSYPLMRAKLIYLAANERLKTLETITMELSGGRTFNCFGPLYFPVILKPGSDIDLDQGGEIRISLGQYWSDLYPGYAQLIVGRDTLPIEEDGTFTYHVRPRQSGKNVLPLRIRTKNHRTGVFDEEFISEYVYWAR